MGMRNALILILICLMPSLAAAQSSGFEVGGNVGLNSSWIINQNAYEVLELLCTGDPLIAGSEPGYSLTPGFSIGALGTYNSGLFWSGQVEINYMKAGQNYKESWTDNGCERDLSAFKRKFTLHYLQIPLLFKVHSQNRGKIRGYGEAGPYFSVLMGAREKVTLGGEMPSDVTLTPAKEKVKTLDVGIVLGGGAEINLTRSIYLTAGMRTSFGFIDLNKGGAQAFISANDTKYQKSRNFQAGFNVGVHYVFDWIGAMYR